MPIYENGKTRIHYEEAGSGYPLLLIPGGGLYSGIDFFTSSGPTSAPFNAIDEFKSEYRCITLDLRNSLGGQSTGPLEVDRPWDAFADDQLGLMNHLGIDRFMVLGFCIGGPLIWNLLKRAPERVVAAVISQPSGVRPDAPTLFYDRNMKDWGPKLCAKRPELSMETVEAYLRSMALGKDFVYTVDRDFVRNCQAPILMMPDDVPAHPYAVAMEAVRLAPHGEVCLYPWKDCSENIALARHHVRTFLKANRPANANLN